MRQPPKPALFAFLLSLLVAATASQTLSNAAPPEPEWAATGDVLIKEEWFADIPWHQKLSTNDSNVIDVPFALPYEAIPTGLSGCPTDADETEKARCILRHGIVNVMGFRRTDRLYLDNEGPDSKRCTGGDCVQVKIDIQRFNTQTDTRCTATSTARTDTPCQPDRVTNDGNQGGPTDPNLPPIVPSFGFAITEATIFAPWRPWYMGHYCGYGVPSVTDSVCYDSYFTTQLQAFTNLAGGQNWPQNRGILFYPQDTNEQNSAGVPILFGLYCMKGSTECPMYVGKVDWLDGTNDKYDVIGCESGVFPPSGACEETDQQALRVEIDQKTARLDKNFEDAISEFNDIGRFAWGGETNPKDATIPGAPYLGYYDLLLSQTSPVNSTSGHKFQAARYVLPKRCTEPDFASARRGEAAGIDKLKNCTVNFEIHTSGFFDQWESLFPKGTSQRDMRVEIKKAMDGITNNQYGRTMFLMAGIPEQKIAAPFFVTDNSGRDFVSKLSLYDQIYGASIYTQYLPMVYPDGDKKLLQYYDNNLWHSYFMSNHMNQSPEHFIRGLSGRILWHNEFRSNLMYISHISGDSNGTAFEASLVHRDFPAGFQPADHKVPYHGNTCDSCHVRNGSGIPLGPNGKLTNIHTERGIPEDFRLKPDQTLDYTYTNGMHKQNDKPIVPSMKMVLFDLKAPTPRRAAVCDTNDHTTPASMDHPSGGFYKNKIMNFYGNSFHVNLEGQAPKRLPSYDLRYVEIGSAKDQNAGTGAPYEIVVIDPETKAPILRERQTEKGLITYTPKRAVVSNVNTGNRCEPGDIDPFAPLDSDWPLDCDDVNGPAVEAAINDRQVGYMHLLGKRLGNTPLIEMIPDQTIQAAQEAQVQSLTGNPGCYDLSAGTRAGPTLADLNYRSCKNERLGTGRDNCYIGRWGWIGDRASLEDQVANAAHVEQNISTKTSYNAIHPGAASVSELVRYNSPMCGPANLACELQTEANSDLTEEEVRNMATYQRWIGIPQRSEFQVEMAKVQDGEEIFNNLGCNHCHIIDKIPFVKNDNMLPDEEREKLGKLLIQENGDTDYPFVSYLGTDLLLHDMGYLSQVAKGPLKTDSNPRRRGSNNDDDSPYVKMRDEDGKIRPGFKAYFQLIRTPPLKGMRFNRFVTDSHHNKTNSTGLNGYEARAGCDFLLHDGRACDAIEAAFLHDGPAVKELGMIEELRKKTVEDLDKLRAFLYSL